MTLRRSLALVLAVQCFLLSSLWSQATKEKADLIVTRGTVATMDGARAIYDDGIIVVKGDTIVAVGPRPELEAKYLASETVNAKGGLVLPGFINGHTHAPMTLFRGIHDDVTLNDWLYKYIFPAEKKNVNEEFVRWGTRLAAAEQIRAGVTTFADMYYFEDAVSAHCIVVDEADRKTLAQRQVGCVHNPSSNMMIASGVAPVPEMRAEGVAVGLGTDGPAGSNNDLDLMEEMDLAAKLAKITKMNPLALNAKAVVEMATIDGAKALHMEKEIGSLEAGKKADIVLISLDEPNAVPMYA